MAVKPGDTFDLLKHEGEINEQEVACNVVFAKGNLVMLQGDDDVILPAPMNSIGELNRKSWRQCNLRCL